MLKPRCGRIISASSAVGTQAVCHMAGADRGRGTCLKAGPAPARPMSTLGLMCSTTSFTFFRLGVSSRLATTCLWLGSLSPRDVVTRPLLSTM